MTTDEARAARDAALLAWYAAGPASLSAESDAAWAAYKAASAAVERARNLPEGGGTPAPPPPPPPVVSAHSALVLEMHAAARAEADAREVFDAMNADLATYGPYIHAAWDRAHLAVQERYRTLTAYQNARKWQAVRVLVR